jgi:hypothetical protein
MKKLIALFILFFTANSFSQTNVSGGIYQNTTWTQAGSPYFVTGSIVVFPGKTLTIEPGCEVRFTADNTFNTGNFIYLEIRGTLIALGTDANKIKFTSYYAGNDRQSIVFNKTDYAGLSVIEAIKNKLEVSVYPNPASENIFVSLNSNVKQAQVTISNLSGKALISTEITADDKVDVSGLPMGMYLLTIATNNGSETVKFIKQ